MRVVWTIVASALVLGLIGGIVVAVVRVPSLAVTVPILAIGLALALQKYVASFFSYFMIVISRIYGPGDRIRIGNIKGDVRWIGLIHTTLEEVGEDEKLGGELTGRLVHVPNLVILDQPVLNYSKDYSIHHKSISSDYMFDEIRIPITVDSNVDAAIEVLDDVLKSQDEVHLTEARRIFKNGYPKFLDEAMSGTRVLIHVEPQRVWIKGKFVAPVRQRNQLKSQILASFLDRVKSLADVKLA